MHLYETTVDQDPHKWTFLLPFDRALIIPPHLWGQNNSTQIDVFASQIVQNRSSYLGLTFPIFDHFRFQFPPLYG
jgi:hypothetical protein